MSWTAGRPLLGLIALASITGVIISARQPQRRGDLLVWVFDQSHAQMYGKPLPDGSAALTAQFESAHRQSVSIELLSPRALDARLVSLFMSNQREALPDLVEIDIASIGKYFRAPPSQIPFLPLNSLLERDHLTGLIEPTRLATWSKQGTIFGIPHDLHPVMLAYRKDLFDVARVDLEQPRTWPQLQAACLQFQRYWTAHGFPNRRALELDANNATDLVMLLLARHINLIDGHGNIHLEEPLVLDTLVFYTHLVAGARAIGRPTLASGGFAYAELSRGDVCAMLMPDWRVHDLKNYAPELAGKLRMRPMPIFDDTDSPTSTWGGTMIGIPRQVQDPEKSWQLLKYLYFSPQALAARRAVSNIIPPEPAFWSDEAYKGSDPFFGGQRVDALYISLAPRIPPRYATEFTTAGQTALGVILARAMDFASQGHTEAQLRAACQGWLHEAAAQLREWIDHGSFDD